MLHPFIILAKKRYVGNLYEDSPDKFKQKSMGIVLKRRDNAPIVKLICGQLVQKMLLGVSNKQIYDFIQNQFQMLLDGKFEAQKFVISKTLKARAEYKDRSKIAHAVLADRMEARDKGTAPKVGDRIPYIYIQVPKNKFVALLQGDFIEDPAFIAKNKLRIDYLVYLNSQLRKPCAQFLELVVGDADRVEDMFNLLQQSYLDRMLGQTKLCKDVVPTVVTEARTKTVKIEKIKKVTKPQKARV